MEAFAVVHVGDAGSLVSRQGMGMPGWMKGIELELKRSCWWVGCEHEEKRAALHLAASLLTPELPELEDREFRPLGGWILEPNPGFHSEHSRQWDPEPHSSN